MNVVMHAEARNKSDAVAVRFKKGDLVNSAQFRQVLSHSIGNLNLNYAGIVVVNAL